MNQELQSLNEQNPLALWAERISDCRSKRATCKSVVQVCTGQGIHLSERAVTIPDQLSQRRQTGTVQQPGREKYETFRH